MQKWKVRKNNPYLGGWRVIGPYGSVRHEETFADAIDWLDRELRTTKVVMRPDYTADPTVQAVGRGQELLMFIHEDREHVGITSHTGGMIRFPLTLLPELATAALTLYSQHLCHLHRVGLGEVIDPIIEETNK